jgi:uncharacterized membrane protein YczE
MPRRLIQLLAGLVLYGISDSMLLLAGLGVDPWDVLHQGLARRTGLATGTWVIIVGAAVLLLWIPLRQRPGIGTLCNVVLIGVVIDAVLATVAPPHSLPVRAAVMLAGVGLNGVATGLYIGAGLGPGPRDGLMTGLAARGHSIRIVRTGIEITVLLIGWLLGGTVGVGTVIYAACIGPLAHIFVPLFSRSAGCPGLRVPEESRHAAAAAVQPGVPARPPAGRAGHSPRSRRRIARDQQLGTCAGASAHCSLAWPGELIYACAGTPGLPAAARCRVP